MGDQAHKITDEKLARLEKRLFDLYAKAGTELAKKQTAFMNEYARDYPKMQQLVDEGKLKEADFIEWVREQAIKERWYDQMVDTFATHAVKYDQMAMGMINGYTPEIYADNFNWGTYQIEKGTGISTMFSIYDRATVERLLKDNPDLIPKAGVNTTRDYTWNKQKFTSAITQGILQGESIDGIASRLHSVIGMDLNNAIRTARTATTSAENGGRIDSYKRAEQMGIGLKKMWIATLDGRTRHSHRLLDKVAIPVDESFDNGCAYPGDPSGPPWEVYNCRCTLIADMEETNVDKAERFQRLEGMTYEEWKEYEGKPISPKRQQKAQEDAPDRTMTRYARDALANMGREELKELARAIFVRRNMEKGIPRAEAERRFDLLIGGNTNAQLRDYIYKYQ